MKWLILHRFGFVFVFFHVFVVDLLQRVLSTMSLFVGFYNNSSNYKIQYNRVIKSNHVHQYVLNQFFFIINVNDISLFKIFNIFDSVCLSMKQQIKQQE